MPDQLLPVLSKVVLCAGISWEGLGLIYNS